MFVVLNEIKYVLFKSVRGTLMEDIVFVASGNSPGPEEARSHVKKCTMQAIRPGSGSLSCL